VLILPRHLDAASLSNLANLKQGGAGMARLWKQIEMAARRRARQPRPQADQPVKLTVSPGQRDAFTGRHAELLLSIESILVQVAEQIPEVDDFVVEQALRAAIRSRPALDCDARSLADLLEQLRVVQEVDAEIWQTALRVIYTSMNTWSDCHRGDYDYLAFAADFVQRAGGP
jgi:hypothetical protein